MASKLCIVDPCVPIPTGTVYLQQHILATNCISPPLLDWLFCKGTITRSLTDFQGKNIWVFVFHEYGVKDKCKYKILYILCFRDAYLIVAKIRHFHKTRTFHCNTIVKKKNTPLLPSAQWHLNLFAKAGNRLRNKYSRFTPKVTI